MWQSILDTVDRVESWLVLLPLVLQIPLLLVVLVPLCWGLARLVDPLVERFLGVLHRGRAPSTTPPPDGES